MHESGDLHAFPVLSPSTVQDFFIDLSMKSFVDSPSLCLIDIHHWILNVFLFAGDSFPNVALNLHSLLAPMPSSALSGQLAFLTRSNMDSSWFLGFLTRFIAIKVPQDFVDHLFSQCSAQPDVGNCLRLNYLEVQASLVQIHSRLELQDANRQKKSNAEWRPGKSDLKYMPDGVLRETLKDVDDDNYPVIVVDEAHVIFELKQQVFRVVYTRMELVTEDRIEYNDLTEMILYDLARIELIRKALDTDNKGQGQNSKDRGLLYFWLKRDNVGIMVVFKFKEPCEHYIFVSNSHLH
ncbi:hypothetical protein Tco_0882902, partial [Tanacetum coccineum]